MPRSACHHFHWISEVLACRRQTSGACTLRTMIQYWYCTSMFNNSFKDSRAPVWKNTYNKGITLREVSLKKTHQDYWWTPITHTVLLTDIDKILLNDHLIKLKKKFGYWIVWILARQIIAVQIIWIHEPLVQNFSPTHKVCQIDFLCVCACMNKFFICKNLLCTLATVHVSKLILVCMPELENTLSLHHLEKISICLCVFVFFPLHAICHFQSFVSCLLWMSL